MIGCVGVSFVCVLVCGGGFWYLSKNIGEIARKAIVSVIESSELSDEDKEAVTAQVDRIVAAYESGEIDWEDVGRIMEQLAESPLLGLIIVYATDATYITPSGLTDEEKEEGRLTMQRVARGVFEETIDRDELESAMDYVSVEGSGGNRQFKDRVSDADLRQFLAECKRHADEAEVPLEPFELNIGEEFKRAVDEALGEG